jgi:hypothetical protein
MFLFPHLSSSAVKVRVSFRITAIGRHLVRALGLNESAYPHHRKEKKRLTSRVIYLPCLNIFPAQGSEFSHRSLEHQQHSFHTAFFSLREMRLSHRIVRIQSMPHAFRRAPAEPTDGTFIISTNTVL